METKPIEIIPMLKIATVGASANGYAIDSHDANGANRGDYILIRAHNSALNGAYVAKLKFEESDVAGMGSGCADMTLADGATDPEYTFVASQTRFFVLKRTKRYIRAVLTKTSGTGTELVVEGQFTDDAVPAIITSSPITNS